MSPVKTPAEQPARAPKGIAWKLALLFLVVFGIGGLSLEMLVRARQFRRYGTTAPTMYRSHVDPVSQLPIPVSGQNTSHIWINSRGFRSPEIAVAKPPGTLRIAFLGASTTFCAEVSGNEATWPHLVWRAIRDAAPDISVEYVNAGVIGYTAEASLVNWEKRAAPLDPDIVVLYEGINDFTKDTRALAAQQGLPTGVEGRPNFLERNSVAWTLISRTVKLALRSRTKPTPLHFDSAALAAQGFEGRLQKLVAEAGRGRLVVLPTISIRLREEQSPDERRRAAEWGFYYMPYMTAEGLLAGYGQYNAVIRAVAAANGAILAGGETSIPGDSAHFKDFVHFTDEGCRLMAKRVTDALLRDPAFRRLLDQKRNRTRGA